MGECDEKALKIAQRLHRQAGGLFRRGDLTQRDRELVEKWILEFARMCQMQEENEDESS